MPPSTKPFSVIGVDLAARPEDTAYCEIEVSPKDRIARVLEPVLGADDTALLKLFAKSDITRIGIDAPFGWPQPFVVALPHAQCNVWPCDQQRKGRHFANLTLRSTDIHVDEKVGGVTPLSVSADKLAVLAMRVALLLSRAPAPLVDRSGMTGHFVEVYPAAGLGRWKIKRTDYKKNKRPKRRSGESVDKFKQREKGWPESNGYQARVRILERIRTTLPQLAGLNRRFEEMLLGSDHYIDAFVSALVALMVEIDPKRAKGFIEPIPAGMEAVAQLEGWIALPRKCSLTRLGLWLEERRRKAGGIA